MSEQTVNETIEVDEPEQLQDEVSSELKYATLEVWEKVLGAARGAFGAPVTLYQAREILSGRPRLGYGDVVIWDRGLHGYPLLREELAFRKAPVRVHVGCRFTWRGQAFGALADFGAQQHALAGRVDGAADGDQAGGEALFGQAQGLAHAQHAGGGQRGLDFQP